jgi:hypothetical protein|tara:strand:+ start:375 stop:758 length:384 start_codon:yes stop_codon:yes gene_type:complete
MIYQILSGLYICNINDSYDKTIYDKYDIDMILNCSTNLPFVEIDIEKVRIPISNINTIKVHKEKILNFIKDNYLEKNILIISNEDFNIIICSLFIIKYGNISIIDISNILKMKHKNLIINRNISELI